MLWGVSALQTSEQFQDSSNNDKFLILCCLPFLVSKAVMISFLQVFLLSQLIFVREVWTLESYQIPLEDCGPQNLLKPLFRKVRKASSRSNNGMLSGKQMVRITSFEYRKQGQKEKNRIHAPLQVSSFLSIPM